MLQRTSNICCLDGRFMERLMSLCQPHNADQKERGGGMEERLHASINPSMHTPTHPSTHFPSIRKSAFSHYWQSSAFSRFDGMCESWEKQVCLRLRDQNSMFTLSGSMNLWTIRKKQSKIRRWKEIESGKTMTMKG